MCIGPLCGGGSALKILSLGMVCHRAKFSDSCSVEIVIMTKIGRLGQIVKQG